MSSRTKSTALYAHPFSRQYWKDAAAELKDTRMLVVAALMIALRVALKMVYIPLAPSVRINTAFIANATGAMIFGPVMAALAAIVSDFLGVMLSGEPYFLPMVLTEIAGSVIFALFFYRAKITPIRVMLSRFCTCFFVNILLQTPLKMLYYQIILGGKTYILTIPHILKNLFAFPLESVILTLLLSLIQPVTYRMKLTYTGGENLRYSRKQVAFMVALFLVGCACVTGYLSYFYQTTSRSAGYTDAQRRAENHAAAQLVTERTDDWDWKTVVCVVDSVYQGLFQKEADYTVAVYVLDEEAFAAGQAADPDYTMDTLWGYSKSGPKKDEYQSLVKVADAKVTKNEKTGEILSFDCRPVQ